MTAATWMADLDAAVVAALQADADFASLFTPTGLITVGLVIPPNTQDIPTPSRPYCGVKSIAYSKDLGRVPGGAVGFSVHDVTVKIDVLHAYNPQLATEQVVQSILAQLAQTIGRQRKPNPFGLNNGTVQSIDMDPGAGQFDRVQPQGSVWEVDGYYTFTVRIRLKLT